MSAAADVWAVLPVKELSAAKQRMAPRLSPAERVALAQVCAASVLDALAATRGLAGIVVVTLDPWAAAQAARVGARVLRDGARDGHTGAVAAAMRLLAEEGRGGALAVPGDIPAATPAEFFEVLTAHAEARPAFTIAPSHDGRGSNAVLCSPPGCVPLRFGDDSFLPHLDAARARGITPRVVRGVPGIGMDLDRPEDLAAFLRLPQAAGTRTRAWLEENGVAGRVRAKFPPPPAGEA